MNVSIAVVWQELQVVSKTKHSKTKPEHEAPKTRKRSTQISKTRHPRLENEAPKSRNHCRLKNYNIKSCMTQAEPGGGNALSAPPKVHKSIPRFYFKPANCLTERF